MPNRFYKIGAAIFSLFICLSTLTTGCELAPGVQGSVKYTHPSGLDVDLLQQAWNIIENNYIEPDKIDAAAVNIGAVKGLFQSLNLEYTIPASTPSAQGLDLQLINEAWNTLITQVGKDKLIAAAPEQGAIDGMIRALNDSHSRYYSPIENKLEQENLEGNYYGIGVLYYLNENKKLIIDAVVDNSPAQKAGLTIGDTIISVNGISTAGMTEEACNAIISDESQAKVDFIIERENISTPLAITVNKGKVNIISVTSHIVQDIACIRISDFTLDTDDELQAALKNLDKTAVKGIVLDLRDNSEGTFISALEIANHFLENGPVMRVRDSKGNTENLDLADLFKDQSPTVPANNNQSPIKELTLPLVVLVNESTAGCSEALSGALQDRGRAKIAGTATYGNGSEIAFFDLRDGSAICLTVEHLLTPGGKEIEGKGITPDYPITQTGDDAVQSAVDYLHSNPQK